MIIWGWKGREILQNKGRFYCPQCQCEQEYKRMRVSTYFTLYFVPLFETRHHGDFVQCGGCNAQFSTEVLQYKPPTNLDRLAHATRCDLEMGTPFEMVRRKLLNAGMAPDDARNLITVMAGEDHETCPACGFTYLSGVEQCCGCGGRLNDKQALLENAA